MDGVDEVDKSLWHDKTQDEAHADHNGIGRGPHPGKKEWERQWHQPGGKQLCHDNPDEGAVAAVANEEQDTDGERGDPTDMTRVGRNHLPDEMLVWQLWWQLTD